MSKCMNEIKMMMMKIESFIHYVKSAAPCETLKSLYSLLWLISLWYLRTCVVYSAVYHYAHPAHIAAAPSSAVGRAWRYKQRTLNTRTNHSLAILVRRRGHFCRRRSTTMSCQPTPCKSKRTDAEIKTAWKRMKRATEQQQGNLNQRCDRRDNRKCAVVTSSCVNPFSPTLFLIVAKMSLPKRSAPYWSNPRF